MAPARRAGSGGGGFVSRCEAAQAVAIPSITHRMAAPSITSSLRRSLLIKIISKPAPSKEDVASVIELTASKVVEALNAQSMTLYMVEGNDIAFKHVYYSPTLWAGDRSEEHTSELQSACKLVCAIRFL